MKLKRACTAAAVVLVTTASLVPARGMRGADAATHDNSDTRGGRRGRQHSIRRRAGRRTRHAVAAGKPLLRLPLVSSNVTTIANSLERSARHRFRRRTVAHDPRRSAVGPHVSSATGMPAGRSPEPSPFAIARRSPTPSIPGAPRRRSSCALKMEAFRLMPALSWCCPTPTPPTASRCDGILLRSARRP